MCDENQLINVGSLFSGIGGIDLAFQWAGFEIAFQVEIDDFCQAVLRKNFPTVPKFKDICHVRGSDLPSVDVLAGGFPCQNISITGKRKGLEGEQSVLWTEFARLLGELRPSIAFVENVPNITRLGGTRVVGDLAALGYDAEWGIVPANAVGSPQSRKRWFLVGYANGERYTSSFTPTNSPHDQERHNPPHQPYGQNILYSPIPNDALESRITGNIYRQPNGKSGMVRILNGLSFGMDGHKFPAPSNEPSHKDEPDLTIERGSDPHWAARMKALGNAVVPQVVYPFALKIHELLMKGK